MRIVAAVPQPTFEVMEFVHVHKPEQKNTHVCTNVCHLFFYYPALTWSFNPCIHNLGEKKENLSQLKHAILSVDAYSKIATFRLV